MSKNNSPTKKSPNGNTIATKKLEYKSMDQRSHVLHRPGMYIGSTKPAQKEMYVAEKNIEDEKGGFNIVKKEIQYIPGLDRIFIEILSNAIDNVWRSREFEVDATKIKVNIDPETGETKVLNDGMYIECEKNPNTGLYNVEMIFGKLLSGSNYNDEEERKTAGLNGLGCKLTSIFSTKFYVKTVDPKNGKIYEQTWEDNMSKRGEPKITNTKLKAGLTEVIWTPDFSRFACKGYSDDMLSIIYKHVIDAAMITKIGVYLNDEKIPVKTLSDYAKLYITNEGVQTITLESSDCEAVLMSNSDEKSEYDTISFVNGIETFDGGVHTDAWTNALLKPLLEKINSGGKKDSPQLVLKDIKPFFKLFVNASVDKPEFSSQEKTKLTAPQVKTVVETKNINAIMKWNIIENIRDIIRGKELLTLKKTEKKKGFKKIEGYDPANNAGGKESMECTLILCEGLSAKTYAVMGVDAGVYGKKGRDYFGIYPLRGKILNSRNANISTIAKNREITDIIQALGLRYGVDYTDEENFKTLNYGKLMLLTDADSVSADTPLLLKKNDIVEIKTIDDIAELKWEEKINGKEYNKSSYQVWTESGWTNIKHIMRHKVNKKMYRVLTHTGLVDVTEDHSLLSNDGQEITPNQIKIGEKLLHSYPNFVDINYKADKDLESYKIPELKKIAHSFGIQNISKNQLTKSEIISLIKPYLDIEYLKLNKDYGISEEEAWVMGFFWADGSCGIYDWKYNYKSNYRPRSYTFNRHSISWAISNTNIEWLEKSQKIMKNIYPDYDWVIIEDRFNESVGKSKNYKLNLNGGSKVTEFVEKYKNLFYDKDKNKKIPIEILNSPLKVREQFFEGFLYGDGNKNNKTELKEKEIKFDINGKIGANGIFFLARSIGYKVSINTRPDKPKIISMNITKGLQQFDKEKIKKIVELEDTEQYVYDLETENHHFQAGIGQMIVHNTDGIHISGLIINFIHSLFPSLIKREESFIVTMKTPIIRIYFKDRDVQFYSSDEYTEFIKKNPDHKGRIKYFKGLGTSNDKEIRDSFGKKIVEYIEDEKTDENINKVFHTKFSNQRKDWLEAYDPTSFFINVEGDDSITQMSFSDFIDTEMIKFSIDDCKRSIPNLMDGLKESHRKILYACFLKNLKNTGKTLKVAQLAGFVAEKTNYHHGEQCLFDTITKMAHDFPGSNNIPFLFRDGQMGTRLQGGKDAASARYIFTKLEVLTRLLFKEEDDPILSRVEDDGEIVEPVFYAPIIPTILINGSEGIGTGWSCSVPCYNPLDLVKSVKIWLEKKSIFQDEEKTFSLLPEIQPWYRGFTGKIEKVNENKFQTIGSIKEEKGNKVTVNELPVGLWTEKFKEYVEDLLEDKKIKGYKNYSTPDLINFQIQESANGLKCNVDNLKLKTSISTSNMVLFTEKGTLKKYNSVDEIIDDFCKVRYDYYILRKAHILNGLKDDLKWVQNKFRFLKEVMEEELVISKRDEEDVISDLESRGYDKKGGKSDEEEVEDEKGNGSYRYLLDMKIRSFTKQKLEELQKEIDNLERTIKKVTKTTEDEMWIEDLDTFEKAYNSWLNTSLKKYKQK